MAMRTFPISAAPTTYARLVEWLNGFGTAWKISSAASSADEDNPAAVMPAPLGPFRPMPMPAGLASAWAMARPVPYGEHGPDWTNVLLLFALSRAFFTNSS